MALQHLRSGTANKRPVPTAMSDGQLAVNTNLASPGLFFKDSNGDLVKAGPVHVGSTAPNASPASTAATALVANTVYQILTIGTSDFTAVGASANTVGVVFTASGTTTGTGTVSGQQGNEKGEQWLDTTNSLYVMKVYDGTGWRVTDSISLANGTAAAPSLHFGSDTNTGLFRSAADELAVTTAGTQRVTVDSSGNVVVGATAFNSGFLSLAQIEASGTEGGIVINSSDTSANKYSRLAFTKGNAAGNEGLIRYNVNDYHMAFYTNGAEKLRIDSSGRLLINHTADTAPAGYSSKLQLCDTSYEGASILIRRDQNNGSAPALLFAKTRSSSKGGSTAIQNGDLCGQIIWYVGDGTDANSQVAFMQAAVDGTPGSNDTPGRLEFHTTADGASLSTERMRIDSSGNLTFSQSASSSPYPEQKLKWSNDSTTANGFYISQGTDRNGKIWHEQGLDIQFATNNTERMRIDSAGRLMLGTVASGFANSAHNFTIADPSGGNCGMTIRAGSSSSVSSIYFADGTSGSANYEGFIDYQHSVNALRLGTGGGQERMRIDSVGHCTHYRNTTTTGVGLLQCNSDIGGSNRAQWYVLSNGSVENRTGAYGTIASDERVKKDIVDATSQWEDIKNIKMRKFRYKTDGNDSQLQLGVIAQELEVVCPNLVTRKPATAEMSDESGGLIAEGEDILSWKQSIVHLKALKALQEAMERIEQLETKVAALEAG